ncbi:PfkB family carbohydrate kinase [Cohnella cellulosilytica]|uniref:PfkB family carbohydrate kinase n=1 Tax=Cohnella cellulosilytica TaxID=986710 RepID=A0ABW2F891_9BACL
MSGPIVFVGAATLDHIALVDRVPRSDQRIPARELIQCGGGPAANAAAAARALGAPCALISAVGDDAAGAAIAAELERDGIAAADVQVVRGGRSSTSLIHVESSGLRTITYYGGVLQAYDLARFPLESVERCALVHADGNFPELTLLALQTARRCGKITSLDGGNIREADLERLLPYVDVFITDVQSLPQALSGLSPEQTCLELGKSGPSCTAVTLGKRGCALWSRTHGFTQVQGVPVKALDTTGAGDNFHGAFAYGLWKGMTPFESLRLANAFAALSCEGLGGRGRLASFEEIDRLYLRPSQV